VSGFVAPSAKKVACVDLDRTIIPWGSLHDIPAPIEGAADAIRALKAAGYRIVILTSRYSPTWWDAEVGERGVDFYDFAMAQKRIVVRILEAAGISFDRITSEKVPAAVYFDDKAITVSDAYPLAQAVADFLAREEAAA
jgi:hypothetical protein